MTDAGVAIPDGSTEAILPPISAVVEVGRPHLMAVQQLFCHWALPWWKGGAAPPNGNVAAGEVGVAAAVSAPPAMPAQPAGAPEGRVLTDPLSDSTPMGGEPVALHPERVASALGSGGTGGTLLGVVPATPLPVMAPLGTLGQGGGKAGASLGLGGPALFLSLPADPDPPQPRARSACSAGAHRCHRVPLCKLW